MMYAPAWPASTSCASDQPLRLAVLGASGSVGTQTLEVVRQHPEHIKLLAVSVHNNLEVLAGIVAEFHPQYIAVTDAQVALQDIAEICTDYQPQILRGQEALVELATLDDIDVVLNAVVGFAGLDVAYAALRTDKRLAYANKESIVVGGDLLLAEARPGQIIPVDSEHSAIFQCLVGERPEEVARLWLTCSGGPFFGKSAEELTAVTASQALKHPTWNMGAKITIDSATLMNKALEVIEAERLFGISQEKISVVVHRQSINHSMVEFVDGSTKAHFAYPDMMLPIRYALSYPYRWQTKEPTPVWSESYHLDFEAVDETVFRALALARIASSEGGTMPCVLNAANEIVNEAFRHGRCAFLDIAAIVEQVMDLHEVLPVDSLLHLHEVDQWARTTATRLIGE